MLLFLQPSPLSFSLLFFHSLSFMFFIYLSISIYLSFSPSFIHSLYLSLSITLCLSLYSSLYYSSYSLNSLPSSVHTRTHTCTHSRPHAQIDARTHHFQVVLCIVMLASGFLILVFLNYPSPCPPSPFPCLLSWLRC